MTAEAVFGSQSINPAHSAKVGYRPEIDGLRAVAIIPVLLFHAGFRGFEHGFLGVDIFFVISGYLITGILLAECGETGRISIASFYERRVRRIFPALIIVVAGTAAASWTLLTPVRMEEFARSVVSAFTFSANFWFLTQTHYFSTASDEQPLIHLWSLGVEEQFYILLPLLLMLTKRLSARTFFLLIGALACASLAYAQFISASAPDAAFYRPDTRAWELLMGSLVALRGDKDIPFRGGLAAIGAALIALSLFVLPNSGVPNALSLPVCAGTALLLLSADRRVGVGRLLSSAGMRNVGLISYPLYLWHQPLFALARIHQMGPLTFEGTCEILLTSVVLAAATWAFVEKPFRNRNAIGTSAVFLSALSASAILIAFGLGGAATGYSLRYGELADKYFAAVGTVDDQTDTRSVAIGMGVCHYRPDMSPPLDQFLANWKCTGSGAGATMLVVGDSHAADKAAALKLNGIEVGQMTGAGCSAVPSLMVANCRQMFDQILNRFSNNGRYTRLIIANKQLPDIYSADQIEEAIAYWKPLGAQIVWFSDMPQFADLEDRKASNLRINGEPFLGDFPVSVDQARENFAFMHGLERGRFTTINSAEVYCSMAGAAGCVPYVPGRLGWVAAMGGHLTASGAYLFGQQLLKEGNLR